MGPKRERVPDLPADWSTFVQQRAWEFDEQPDLGMHRIWEAQKSEDTRMNQIGAASLLDIEGSAPKEEDCRFRGMLRAILKVSLPSGFPSSCAIFADLGDGCCYSSQRV